LTITLSPTSRSIDTILRWLSINDDADDAHDDDDDDDDNDDDVDNGLKQTAAKCRAVRHRDV